MSYKKKLSREEIGLSLYRLLEKSGYSYGDVADFLELSTTRVIYDWTSGKKLPSGEKMYNLLFVLLNE